MSIAVEQTCDRCGANRELAMEINGTHYTIEEAARRGGWAVLPGLKHLCARCVKGVLKR